jgi:hypothetical protein
MTPPNNPIPLEEAVAKGEAALRVAAMYRRDVIIEPEVLRTIINALPDEEMVARALAEADGIREWDKLNKAGFAGSPRFVNKDYWFTQARAAISTLYKGVK